MFTSFSWFSLMVISEGRPLNAGLYQLPFCPAASWLCVLGELPLWALLFQLMIKQAE